MKINNYREGYLALASRPVGTFPRSHVRPGRGHDSFREPYYIERIPGAPVGDDTDTVRIEEYDGRFVSRTIFTVASDGEILSVIGNPARLSVVQEWIDGLASGALSPEN